MESIECVTTRETLSARADGEATSDDLALAGAHLAGCAECRQFASDMERIDRMIRIRPGVAWPSSLATWRPMARWLNKRW